MSQEIRKQNRIKKIMDDAAKALEAEGVKYFIGVVDRQPKASDGGKAYAQSDITGEDMCFILDISLPTRQDKVNLGIWLGRLLAEGAKEQKKQKKG